MDHFFTPAAVAKGMIECVNGFKPTVVADFAAGYGELLSAARVRWPRCAVVATDISSPHVRSLKRNQGWKIGQCDFLNIKSRQKCGALKVHAGTVSLALLNPPFSERGARTSEALLQGKRLKCSLALAFIITATDYLHPDGQIVAILPAGTLASQKDEEAWKELRQYFRVDLLGTNGRNTFAGCFPRTVIVRLTNHRRVRSAHCAPCPRAHSHRCIRLSLIRGTVPMHTVRPVKRGRMQPLIHSTELRDNAVLPAKSRVPATERSVVGPAVLLPRVGQPVASKVSLYLSRRRIALSDCVFGLQCSTPYVARRLHSLLVKEWPQLEKQYTGTCARYLTVRALTALLERLGCMIE
jgi:hypothetical protein